MEYFLGSLTTILAIAASAYFLRSKIADEKIARFSYSQSFIHDVLSPHIPTNQELIMWERPESQSTKHTIKNTIRVLFVKEKAYWIQDNKFYSANHEDGVVDKETTLEVDIMGMNKVQLNEMVFVVEKLTEGIKNETWNPRKP